LRGGAARGATVAQAHAPAAALTLARGLVVQGRRFPEERGMTTKSAKDVMTSPVLGVRPDMTVRELATFLTDHQISGAPVLDASNRIVGVVSTTDLAEGDSSQGELATTRSDPARDVRDWEDRLNREDLRALHVEEGDLLVQDIMTPAVYTVPEEARVEAMARTMVAGRIHRLFVTRAGRVVGIVTSLDLLKLLFEGEAGAS
jgi:CBS domain-containing protein